MSLGPFDFTGESFLILYLVLLAAAIIAGFVIPWRMRPEGRGQSIGDPDQIAFLAGGSVRFVDALVSRLLANGKMALAGSAGFSIDKRAKGDTVAEQRILALSSPIAWTTILKQVKSFAEPVERTLSANGLLMDAKQISDIRFWQTLPYIMLIGFGATKWIIGDARERPVGFLTILLFITLVIAVCRWFSIDRRTQAAIHALADARLKSERLKIAPTRDEIGMAVALFGTTVLAGSAYAEFHRMRSSSGDSGSSASSDSDSSGCGGGGCGGCGS